MCWNPPDPADRVQEKLALYDDEKESDLPYEIRVFQPDRTPTIETFWSTYEFDAREEELRCGGAEYEIIHGPDDLLI